VQGEPLFIQLPKSPKPRLWSPDDPYLYGLRVSLKPKPAAAAVDEVGSYFAMRKIASANGADGVLRMTLNGKPVFMLGFLDQGFWPDGLYTAPTDAALRSDIEFTKRIGFNMIRKHVKVEPARWYWWCDKLGMLVWQDMPHGNLVKAEPDGEIRRAPESALQFEAELAAMMDALRIFPCIVVWVPFNEGWGQYDTARITQLVKKSDPTRLVNSASGWTDKGTGDLRDIHVYPGPESPALETTRVAVLGEFGGLGLPLEGHTWQSSKNWGYRNLKTRAELAKDYLAIMDALAVLAREKGLCAAVYTQTTDVEGEVNGIMTYDRKVVKIPVPKLAAASRKVIGAMPVRVCK
jgi:hypothetical protein